MSSSLRVKAAGVVLAAGLCLAGLPALAQNSIRVPVQAQPQPADQVPSQAGGQAPVPMQIIDQDTPLSREKTVENTAEKTIEKAPAKAQPSGGEKARPGKFPNVDTAKNRQDYGMGTETGSDFIKQGRDETTGDTVVRHNPPKKKQEKNALSDQPIVVRPIIPMGR